MPVMALFSGTAIQDVASVSAVPAKYQTWLDEEGSAHPTVAGTLKLRVFEGLREGSPAARSITSSYLKYMLSANIPSDAALEAQQSQIRKTFNLKDVKLLTEADLSWEKGLGDKASHGFRLDGKTYLVRCGMAALSG
jgi:hypothetical protein